MRRRPWALAFFPCALLSAGCFHYTQVPVDEPPVGREVRVRLSERGIVQLVESLADQVNASSRTIEGDLVQADRRSLRVAVPVTPREPGLQHTARPLRQRVTIRLEDVLELELKELDRTKTAVALAGAATVLVAIVVHALVGEFGGTTKGPPEPGPSELIRPSNLVPR